VVERLPAFFASTQSGIALHRYLGDFQSAIRLGNGSFLSCRITFGCLVAFIANWE